MSAARPPAAPADRLRRILAAGSGALVLALTLFAASPVAHAWLHSHDDDDHADHAATVDTCAVAMFANGVTPDPGPLPLGAPVAVARAMKPTTAPGIFLVSPRYLRQPERGPPLGLVD